MDGPIVIGQRRLIRDFVVDRHSSVLLAKAFEQITCDHSQDCSPKGAEQSSRIVPTLRHLLETCK